MQPATATKPIVNLAVKDQLARLLATENLSISHSTDATTAAFNADTRHLVLPVWSKASDDVYDMLVGHEIGHALHSPGKDVCDPICLDAAPMNPTLFFRYLNVVEDIRIENMIKESFPGIRRSFFNGYKELAAADFFGLSQNPVDTLSFADRVNVYAKLGQFGFVDVPFTPGEQEIVDRAMKVRTFDDVAAIAKEIFDYRPEEQGQEEEVQQVMVAGENGEGQTGEQGQGDIQPNNNPTGARDKGADSSQFTPSNKKEVTTDEAFNKAAASMASTSRRDAIDYYDLPRINLDSIIFDWKRISNDLDFLRSDANFAGATIYDRIADRNSNYILNLVKQFEQKMAADTLARTSYKRTGEIDMRRISNYKFADDLFQKNIIVQKGKNHGMVLIMDWSGSMSDCLMPTAEQVMTLALFCRRMRIPFDVYAFTHAMPGDYKDENDDWSYDACARRDASVSPDYFVKNDSYGSPRCQFGNFMRVSKIGLFHFLSSGMNNKEFRAAAEIFLQLAHDNGSNSDLTGDLGRTSLSSRYGAHTDEEKKRYRAYSKYCLSGTPLSEATFVAIDIVNKFRAAHRLDVVNTIFLTDGDPSSSMCDRYSAAGNVILNLPNRRQFQIVANNHEFNNKSFQQLENEGITRLFRAMTGSTAIKMYLKTGTLRHMPYGNFFSGEKCLDDITAATKSWREEKFFTYKDNGHDLCFVIHAGEDIVEDRFAGITEGATVAQIAKAFIKNSAKRATSRVLLSRFTDLIAKQIS